jgi:kinetochore protein NDC80
MLEFLMRRIDASFVFKDPKKPEEETPALFKALKYPFGMSSRSLHSVGTPHAWPNFLAALYWLMELLVYQEMSETHRQELMEEDPFSQESLRFSFFSFVSQAYTAFMSFDDREVALETEFVRTLMDRNRERQEATARLTEHTQQIVEETARLRTQGSRVANLSKNLSSAEIELEQLKAEVARMKQGNEMAALKLQEVKTRGSTQRETVERLQQELTSLDRILRNQAEQHLDVDKLNAQKKDVKNAILTAMNRRDEVEQASSTIEMEISEKFREVERGVSTLNALLDATSLVKTLGGEIRVQPQSPTNILSMDMKISVKPVLLAFLEEKRKLHQQNQPVLVEMQAKADHKKEEVSLKRTMLAELKAKLDRETSKYNGFKDSFLQPRKQLEQVIMELEMDIGAIAISSREALTARKNAFAEMIQKLEVERKTFEKVESDLNTQLERYLDWIVTHKEMVTNKIDSLKSVLERQTLIQ